jgi:hypothetical protein
MRPPIEGARSGRGVPELVNVHDVRGQMKPYQTPGLEACWAFGANAEEALAEVEKAKDAWLAAARDAGKPIPEPRYRPAIYAR